jgi:GNAT superfamily N-acetyltransferase
MTTSPFTLRALTESDRAWVAQYISAEWGADFVVAHGVIYQPHLLPGVVAEQGPEHTGLITYQIEGAQCEVVTLDSRRPGLGIGTALLNAVKQEALQAGCQRLWLITTNDNLNALRFYQKRGFVLAAVHRNALAESRRLKPHIPRVGLDGIPLRDEIELEMRLGGDGPLS